MTKVEYIRQLEFSLTGKLSKREISEILRDYSEYFEAGKAEGKTEEEICVRLGIPSMTAAQILSENEEDAANHKRRAENEGDGEKTYFWESWPDQIGSLWRRMKAWLERVFSRGKAPDSIQNGDGTPEAQAPEQAPQAAVNPPRAAKDKERAQGKRFGWAWLGKTFAFLLALPFMLIAAFAGAALVCLILMGVAALVLGLVTALVFSLAATFVCIASCAIVASAGVPASFIVLLSAFSLFFLAGAVLSCCLIGWLMRWTTNTVHRCLYRTKSKNSSRNPAYHAKVVAEASPEGGWNSPYTDGWQDSAPSEVSSVMEPFTQDAPPFTEPDTGEPKTGEDGDSQEEKEAREDA